MSDIKEIVRKYNLSSQHYQYMKSARVLDTQHGKVVVKKKALENKEEMYEYLKMRDFHYFLPSKWTSDEYEVYPYIEEIKIPSEQKAIDIMVIMSMLHNKTTFYKEIDLDKVKEIYENYHQKIIGLMNHYHHLQDIIETKVYFAPNEYLLIRNISLIYSSLDFSLKYLNKWYDEKVKQSKERIVLLHNKIEINHMIVGETSNLISWDNAKYDVPIYDFLKFYQKEYLNFEMNSLFDIYQSKYQYTTEEFYLFLALITIPDKISIKNTYYQNTYEIRLMIKYVELTRQFVLKEQQKRPETQKQELDEQDNRV